MNQTDTFLQTFIQIVTLLELLVATLAWLLDWRDRANRYLGWLLTLLFLGSFALSRTLVAADVAQVEPWLYVSTVTVLATLPSLFAVTLVLLRPATWTQKRWERWLWLFIHVLTIAPLVLILSDIFLDTNLLYAGPDPQAYRGGFIPAEQYLRGIFGPLRRQVGPFIIAPAAILLVIYTLWRDPRATPLIRRRARWILAMLLTAAFLQIGLGAWLEEPLAITITNLAFTIICATMLLRGLLSDASLRRWLANTRLRIKLNVGLGAAIVGLLVIAGLTVYTSVVNQRLVSRTIVQQRQLADLTTKINNDLLTIQNQAFEFYDTWATTGFERSVQGGFERAREVYLAPVQEQIGLIRDEIAEIERLEPDEETRADLTTILDSINAYETSLLQMSDSMESLGFVESGEVAEMRAVMAELSGLLDETGLESLRVVLLQISEREKEYLLHATTGAARRTQESISQLVGQIAATDDDQLPPADKAQMSALLEQYRDHFLAAARHRSLVDLQREALTDQSDLTRVLVSNLYQQQQSRFNATVAQLQVQQSNMTFVVSGLALLTFFVSVAIVYLLSNQIIQPIQVLGEAARRLGAGELSVRAAAEGRDEIGTTAAAFNLMAEQLQESLTGLEQQVSERTGELERRSAQLEASAEVGRAASSILDADRLVQQVTELIRTRFGLYYVGLFLVDQAGEWATLQAGTGEAGRAMLRRGHRIRVGEGMIGWSILNARARIASQAEADGVRLTTPELPYTRSEAALPLRSRDRVIGALTVQSDRPATFDQNTIVVLQTMVDHVAVALDNARLFTESQAALEAERQAYGELGREAWARLLGARPDMSYRSDEQGVTSAEGAWRPEAEQAMREGKVAQGHGADADGKHPLAVPIKVRGSVVGVLDTYKPTEEGPWTAEEIALLETLTDQLGVALESARLYQDTQRRAARERLTREITDKMRSATGVESIVQTAVDELFSVLGTSHAFVRLGGISSAQDDEEQKAG